MDPLSHALVGGTAATLGHRYPKTLGYAALCGIVAGMAPDLDIVIRETNNPMLGLAFHRHFTHALIFVPLGALIVAMALWPLLKKKLPFLSIYLACFLGMEMHGILDSMTNYGTHLFWPFTNRRESWSIISIIDPIFTLTILGLLITAVVKKSRKIACISAIFMCTYWNFGMYQKHQVTEALYANAEKRGHTVERLEVKPSIGNLFAWRGQYLHHNRIYVDGYHTSPWQKNRVYEGGSLALWTPPKNLSALQTKDVEYFTFFSDQWVAESKNHPGIIGDIRFSILPNQLEPLWGIKLQPDKPDSHVLFENVRSRSRDDIPVLWKMIKGEEL